MTEDEKRLWNLDGKVICSIKAEETDKQLHLLALQESEINLTVAQTALQAGENENGLHYRRKVIFKEDAVRKKSPNGGQIMAALNNLAIGILRKTGCENLAQARRFYEIKVAEELKLIINPIIA